MKGSPCTQWFCPEADVRTPTAWECSHRIQLTGLPTTGGSEMMGQIPQDAANDLGAEEFECKICYSPYSLGSRRPKVLQCGHRLCARCLTKILDQGESPPRSVACPFCRRATSLPSETVGGLPDDGGIVAVLAPQLRGRLDLQHGSTELLLSPHHLNTLVEPFPSPSPGCLVITIMESAGPQQDPRSPPGRQDRRSSSLDSMASMAHRWTPWNCTVRLCQVLARALVWLLGLLYFSSLPLGVYLLIMQKTTLGILLVTLVPGSLVMVMIYALCQCMCHELWDCVSP
ncbi:E3 ubiquitin-protein ligase RNF182-like [Arapaima gigas]